MQEMQKGHGGTHQGREGDRGGEGGRWLVTEVEDGAGALANSTGGEVAAQIPVDTLSTRRRRHRLYGLFSEASSIEQDEKELES